MGTNSLLQHALAQEDLWALFMTSQRQNNPRKLLDPTKVLHLAAERVSKCCIVNIMNKMYIIVVGINIYTHIHIKYQQYKFVLKLE